jgi:2-polyprenyl-6-methoxyphenol hydroxylase-like FAD-dependent oxidoreductase
MLVPSAVGAWMHHIMEHPAHHMNSTIPLYNLKAARNRNARPLYVATNAIVRLYTDARPLHKLCRTAALRLANRIRPLKQLMLSSLLDEAVFHR